MHTETAPPHHPSDRQLSWLALLMPSRLPLALAPALARMPYHIQGAVPSERPQQKALSSTRAYPKNLSRASLLPPASEQSCATSLCIRVFSGTHAPAQSIREADKQHARYTASRGYNKKSPHPRETAMNRTMPVLTNSAFDILPPAIAK